MAKRFTETTKWAKESFTSLSLKMKLVWLYLLDNCDNAGIWDINLPLMSFQIGDQITLSEIQECFGEKIEIVGKKIVIPSFVEFQYGQLNPNNRAHQSVILKLKKIAPSKGLKRSLQGRKDKDKDKDKDKEILLERESEGKPFKISEEQLKTLYAEYPRKEGRLKGLQRAKVELKTLEAYQECLEAIRRYKAHLNANKTECQFIKQFSTFMGCWRDFLDPDFGTSTIVGKNELDFSLLK